MSPSSYRLTRRGLLGAAGLTGAAAAGVLRVGTVWATTGPGSYTAAWSSVDQHPPAPEWFQDAKFGIYYHWGVFSVPAFGNEWYPRNMYINGSNENNHHIATYGDPSVWPYHNFINGARDKAGNFVQFAPKLTSAGGNWDPNAWAQLFADAGAKFAGPVAEHHDGFSMWNSSVNEWNSVATGPKLDLLRLHADAIRAKGLKLFMSLHHAYHFTGYYDHVPAQSDREPEEALRPARHDGGKPALVRQAAGSHRRVPARHPLAGLRSEPGAGVTAAELPRLLLQPGRRLEQGRRRHLQGRASTTRAKFTTSSAAARPDIQSPYWLTDDSVSSSSWCYTVGHRLLLDDRHAARVDRPGQQERQRWC